MKNVYYELSHVYENDEQDEFVKFIGIFSTPKEAWQVIKLLKKKPGFKQYSQKCFHVCKCYIDIVGWNSGFTTWEDAYNYLKQQEVCK